MKRSRCLLIHRSTRQTHTHGILRRPNDTQRRSVIRIFFDENTQKHDIYIHVASDRRTHSCILYSFTTTQLKRFDEDRDVFTVIRPRPLEGISKNVTTCESRSTIIAAIYALSRVLLRVRNNKIHWWVCACERLCK